MHRGREERHELLTHRIALLLHVRIEFLKAAGAGRGEGILVSLILAEDDSAVLAVLEDGDRGIGDEIDEPCCIEGLLLWQGLDLPACLLELLAQELVRHRTAVVIALDLLAADSAQEIDVFPCLCTLCQHVDAHLFGHQHDGADDLAAVLVEVAQESLVDLELVELVILQDVERGVGTAEVVEPDLIARLVELVQLLDEQVTVLDERRLCDFDAQVIARDVVLFDDALDEGERVHQQEVVAREVHRDRDHREVVVHLVAQELCDLLDDVAVEARDQARLFEHRDEAVRRQEAFRGVNPACQGLAAAEFTCHRAHDRLVVDLDMALADGPVEVVEDEDAVGDALAHGLVVEGHRARRILLDAVAGEFCLVEVRRDGATVCAGSRLDDPDARLHRDVGHADLVVDSLADLLELYFEAVARHEEREIIAREARDVRGRERAFQKLSDLAQHAVALVDAVQLIVDLEIRQVQVNRAVAHLESVWLRSLAQSVRFLLYALVESVHVQEACDGVEVTVGHTAFLVDEVQHPDLAERRAVHLVERPLDVAVVARLRVAAERQEGITFI